MEINAEKISEVATTNSGSKYAKYKLKKIYNKYLIIEILAYACPDVCVG